MFRRHGPAAASSVRIGGVLALLLAALAFVIASAATAADVGHAGYVGDAVCLSCHGKLEKHFEMTIHAKVLTEQNGRTPLMKHGCESCHGPGQMHVDAGGGKGTGGPDFISFAKGTDVHRQNAVCLSCHTTGAQLYWKGSPHQSRDVGCTTCHNVMEKVSARYQLAKPTVMATCRQCHLMPPSQVWHSQHMPVREGPASGTSDMGREGWMTCTSCHNPHGTTTQFMISAPTINDKCLSCHADKRGPFLWEHPPVVENCLNCHQPHGSIHRAMLKVDPPRLCQTCHDPSRHPTEARGPGSLYVIGQACLNCHQKVHGSNAPSGMFLLR